MTVRAGLQIGDLVVLSRRRGGLNWRVRCACGGVEVRSSASLLSSRARGRARCGACAAARRRAFAGRSVARAHREMMLHWEQDGTLYAYHEVEDMCQETHEALVAEFGAWRERAPGVEELAWGRREVCS